MHIIDIINVLWFNSDMMPVVSLDEFRKNLSHIMGMVIYGNQTVRVQKHKRMGVIVMSEQEYEYLRDPRKRFSSKRDWDKLFVLADKVRTRMSKKDQEAFESIIDEEVKAVRSRQQKTA